MKPLKFLALLLMILPVLAIGPQIPRYLSWVPGLVDTGHPSPTGYWCYWRTPSGTYTDSNRFAIGPNGQGFDLAALNFQKGLYYLIMTATNDVSESEPSVEYQWRFQNPHKPENLIALPTPP